jgi:glycosyltransferase involved in cell wall biosynthesis
VVNLPLSPRMGPVRYGLALPLVRRAVARIRPDVLIGYRIPSYGVLAFFSGFRPVVVVAQSETELWPPALALKRRLLGRVVPGADLVQVWVPSMEPSLLELGATREKLLTLPRGIEVEEFHPGRDLRSRPFARGNGREENPPGPIRMIVTRTLHEDYNHWHIFEAMALLEKEGLATSLEVVGDGPLRARLQKMADRLVPGRVRFLGKVPHENLSELLRAADLYLSTPITEGLSASLLEAMGCGLYPIVTDHPGNRYLIDDGRNGTLVPVGDVPALAGAIRGAWSRPTWRAEAIVENRALVERDFVAGRNMKRMVERYRDLTREAAPRR